MPPSPLRTVLATFTAHGSSRDKPLLLVLAQFAEAFAGLHRRVARAGLQIGAQDLQQGEFPAAVGANQAIAIAAAELDGNVLEQRLAAKLHGDVGCRNQSRVPQQAWGKGRAAIVRRTENAKAPPWGGASFTRWRAPGAQVYWGTTLVALGPFWPCSTSYETLCPSDSDLKPPPWTAL